LDWGKRGEMRNRVRKIERGSVFLGAPVLGMAGASGRGMGVRYRGRGGKARAWFATKNFRKKIL
jgi:hypothetical protein